MSRIKLWFINLFRDNEVDYINGSETLPPPLEKEEEERLIFEFSQGSEEARNTLIEHNLRLVVYLAKRYEVNSTHLEDLISIGTLGLIKAINTYKSEKNIKLATYASRCIENEILMHLRKKSRMKIEVSFDEPLNVDYDGNELLLSDILGSDENNFVNDIEADEKRVKMMKAINELKKREKQILTMRFGLENGEEMTQKDVADKLGISQSYISRLEKRIIKKLQTKLNK
jgi:RNA polymerase sporulation-specific sigma factor